jgi:hypothetical protein
VIVGHDQAVFTNNKAAAERLLGSGLSATLRSHKLLEEFEKRIARIRRQSPAARQVCGEHVDHRRIEGLGDLHEVVCRQRMPVFEFRNVDGIGKAHARKNHENET